MKKYIPNLFTFSNLVCGLFAIILIFHDQYLWASLLVFLGIFFDFFDGFFARLFGVNSQVGVELDSLADMITSGVVPGLMMYKLLNNHYLGFDAFDSGNIKHCLPFLGFILTLSAAYRLAKFNAETHQHDDFLGLPTPSMAAFVMSIPLVITYSNMPFLVELFSNPVFYLGVIVVLSLLMNSKLHLLSLKLKSLKFSDNVMLYLLIIVSIVLLIFLNFTAIPLIILLYVIASLFSPKKELEG